MTIWALAKKDFRILVRDRRAIVILLAMPLVFIFVLGISLGEGFGQKPLEGLRVSVLVQDEGIPRHFDGPHMIGEGMAWLSVMPGTSPWQMIGVTAMAQTNALEWFPRKSWADMVLDDLSQTSDVIVEKVANMEQAKELVRSNQRAAVLILGPKFSKRVARSSFLASGWRDAFLFATAFPKPGLPVNLAIAGMFDEGQNAMPLYLIDGINPFHRDGVRFEQLDVQVLKDPTQQTAAAIIDQVAQGTMLRVVLPWMIGRAFGKIGEPDFIDLLSQQKIKVKFRVPGVPFAVPVSLDKVLENMQHGDKQEMGNSLQRAIQQLFSKYNLTAKTWASLTQSYQGSGSGEGATRYKRDGAGFLKRGALRYQLLVPSYIVMFAFFLILSLGWLFVAERNQGTMKRLVVAPITRTEILVGKLLPCYAVSLFQGYFLLFVGKLLFGMSWGSAPWWLIPVVATTSFAAVGMAMFVAGVARSETQVAIYGTLLVLVLAGLSGTMMGDRSLMPESMQKISRITPHAWALDAYRQLLINTSNPNLEMVATACLVLTGFGAFFLLLAWLFVRLD